MMAAVATEGPRRRRPAWVAAAVAAVVFAVAAGVRQDAALGLVVLGAVFFVLEHWLPLGQQPWWRPGMATDAVHFVADELIAAPFVAVGLWAAVYLADHGMASALAQLVRSQPDGCRWLESLVLAEVAGYWGHRFQHGLPVLWRFYRLHHSSPVMDWLTPNRRHPVDLIGSRLVVAIPVLLAGFSVPTVAAHFIIRRSQGLFVHANLRITMGPLRWFVAGPAFHHWHHAEERAASSCNFAGEVPLVDWMFGTLYLPDQAWPVAYGIGEDAPTGYLAQLLWPFRTDPRPAFQSGRPSATTGT